MESRFQTSFIPKKPVVSEPVRKPKVVNLFAVLGTVIFVLVVAASVGAFFYKSYLSKGLETSKSNLEGKKKDIDPESIKNIVRLDNKFKSAKVLFDQHLAVSHVFDVLEKITLPSVSFKKFNFSFLGNDKVSLSMKGEATGFSAIAFQSDVINDDPTFKDPLISDLALESSGAVSFTLTTNIKPSILFFKNNLNSGNTTQTQVPPIPDTPVATSSSQQ